MQFLIVGLGSMGKRRARLAKELGHEVFGLDNEKSRREEAKELGIKVFASLEEALKATKYSAAFVCTAPLSHGKITGQLLNAGIAVFSEINLVQDGYEENAELAKQKNLCLFLSSTMLYRQEIAFIQKNVAEFAKPANYIYHIGQYLPDWHPWESHKNFFVGDARTSGVREIFGIELPWLTQTFGMAKVLWAEKSSLTSLDIPYKDSVFVTLRHQNGTRGILAVDVASPKPVRNFEVFGDGLHIFWEGSPNSLFKYQVDKKEKQPVELYQKLQQDPRYSNNIVENAYLDEILNFIAVLEGREKAKWSFEKDGKVIALMDEIERFKG